MKLWKQEQIQELTITNQELKLRMSEMISILDENYGAERQVNDLGGYMMWIDASNEEELKSFLEQYPTLVPESVDIIRSSMSDRVVEILFLLFSDYSVVVYCDYKVIEDYPVIMNELNINE